MKKILFVVESLGGGGAEKVLTTLLRNLDKTKFDITVLTVVNAGTYVEEISAYCHLKYMLPDYEQLHGTFEKIKYKLKYKYIYSQPINRVYSKYVTEKYDVEIGFVEGFSTKFVAASTNADSKKICWVHIDMENNPYADKNFSSLDEERKMYQKFNTIVGVSHSVKTVFERKFRLPDSVTVIYNPIDKEEIICKARKNPVERTSELTMVSVGRLEKQKGYDRLIQALNIYKDLNVNYVLWIIGEGTERKTLEKMIADSELEKYVKLLGFQTNPYRWVDAADVFICSSRAEGYSLAIAEAMLLGKPVLSVDCAGPNELLEFGKYGKLVSNTDQDIQKMIFALLSGKIDLYKYSELALERQSFFELSAIVRQVEELL